MAQQRERKRGGALGCGLTHGLRPKAVKQEVGLLEAVARPRARHGPGAGSMRSMRRRGSCGSSSSARTQQRSGAARNSGKAWWLARRRRRGGGRIWWVGAEAGRLDLARRRSKASGDVQLQQGLSRTATRENLGLRQRREQVDGWIWSAGAGSGNRQRGQRSLGAAALS